MEYTVFDKDGTPIAGDNELHDGLRRAADKHDGWIEADGEKVYPTP